MQGNVAEFGAGFSPSVCEFCLIKVNTHSPSSWGDFHFKTFSNAVCVRLAFKRFWGYLSIHRDGWKSHKVKNIRVVLEFLETPGQSGFLMVFCQFPWSMGGYHHLRDAVTAKDVKGWVLCLPSLLSLSLLSLTFSE